MTFRTHSGNTRFKYSLLVCCMMMLHGAFAQQKFTEYSDRDVKMMLSAAKTSEDSAYALQTLFDQMEFETETRLIDSAIQILDTYLRINERIKLYPPLPYKIYRDALVDLRKGDTLQAIQQMKASVVEFDKYGKIFGSVSLLSQLRVIMSKAGLNNERLEYYTQKLHQYQQKGPVENTAICYHAIGGYYYNFKGDFNEAISNYLKSADAYKSFSIGGYINELGVTGWSYYSWGNYDKAIYYIRMTDSVASHTDINADNIIIGGKRIMALISKYRNNYPEALKYINQGLAISEPRNLYNSTVVCLGEKGGILIEMDSIESGFRVLQEAKKMADGLHLGLWSIQGQFEYFYFMYRYYFKSGDMKNAELSLLAAYAQSKEEDVSEYQQKYCKELVHFYSLQDRFQQADQYALQYLHAADSIRNIQNATNVAYYESERADNEKRAAARELEQQKRTLRNRLLIVLGIVALVAIFILNRYFITRRNKKLLEEKNAIIEQEKNRAEQSEQFKQQFLANMSHEIRTPMNAVSGMTELLIDKQHLPEQEKYLQAIRNSSETLLHIINDILDVSKIEAGKLDLEEIDFSLNEVVGQVMQTLQVKADEKGLQWVSDIHEGVPDVLKGDPHRLKQILINLCSNAIKFTERGSVELKVNVKGEEIQFQITDTGIGIPADKIDLIFENFRQAQSSDTRKYGGTGLGLSISKQLIELQGGHIFVHSEPGLGTTFTVEIPFKQGDKENLQNSAGAFDAIDATALDDLRILLADDNEYNRIVAKDTITSRCKAVVECVASGREVIELLQQQDFDLVLMDVQMPEMNGFEATRFIRTKMDAPKKDIPVIALTASVLRTDLDKCRQAGMNNYVPKPFKAIHLFSMMAEVTGRKIEIEKGTTEKITHMQANVSDLTFLKQFTAGDQQAFKKYILLYIEKTKLHLEKIEQSEKENDLDTIKSMVHVMKGHFKMMGMNSTLQLAVACENSISTGSERLNELLSKLKEECNTSIQELQAAIDESK